MREIGLGGRPRDLEPRHFGANALQAPARVPDVPIVLVEPRAQRLRSLLGLADAVSLFVKSPDPSVEPEFRCPDALFELGPADAGAPVILAARREARLELGAGLLEPADLDGERARPLDERGV